MSETKGFHYKVSHFTVVFKLHMDDETIKQLVKEFQEMSKHHSLPSSLTYYEESFYYPSGEGHYLSIDPHRYLDCPEEPREHPLRKRLNEWYAEYLKWCEEDKVNPAVTLDTFPTVMAYIAWQEEIRKKAREEYEKIERLQETALGLKLE